jgi:hypothetical protein
MLPLLIPSLVQAGLGAYQALTSGAKGAQNDFESYAKQRPLAQESKSLNDYYQEALNRYSENPYQSAFYQQAAQNAQRATAQGLGALQNRRSAIGGIGKLAAIQNDALQRANVQAENYKQQQFSQLGQAAQAKAAQDKYLYDVNQATPYNTMLGIKQMKLQAANERRNAGLNMIGSAASNYALGSMYNTGSMANKGLTSGISPKLTFDTMMSNPELRPQANPNYFPTTSRSQLLSRIASSGYVPKIFGSDIQLPRDTNPYSMDISNI